jgi:hypothetical protein
MLFSRIRKMVLPDVGIQYSTFVRYRHGFRRLYSEKANGVASNSPKKDLSKTTASCPALQFPTVANNDLNVNVVVDPPHVAPPPPTKEAIPLASTSRPQKLSKFEQTALKHFF